MLKLLTSISFLYALAIAILVIYGVIYYRDFTRSARHRKRFPFVFIIISVACLTFLWVNIHAPLNLGTFSNLDHHFIRHDGFRVSSEIELGRSDTINFKNNSYNSFVLSRKKGNVIISSSYSEEPFYLSESGKYKLLSTVYSADAGDLSFKYDTVKAIIHSEGNSLDLSLNGHVFHTTKQVKRGISLWNIFKEELGFVNSSYYNNEKLLNGLKQLYLLNDAEGKTGSMSYFLSGRVFRFIQEISHGNKPVRVDHLPFTATIPDQSRIAWGIGFLSNNRNQFLLQYEDNGNFSVLARYPVSYPLTEEQRGDWSQHGVSKFLLSDSRDMINMPSVFREGFLFPFFDKDDPGNFSPVLLTFQHGASARSTDIKAQWMHKATSITINNEELILPARSTSFSWVFSIQDTFNWQIGGTSMGAGTWKGLMFGSLLLFILLVFCTSLIMPANRLGWVWQLLACITMVLLTTRFFLYWRYKTFPPYEGMDLPSLQQLNSPWNFFIIVFSTAVLAIIFGWGTLRYIGSLLKRSRYASSGTMPGSVYFSKAVQYYSGTSLVKRYGHKMMFFASWLLILLAASVFAAARNFDPATCRHLAIGLVVLYFIYVFISYRHSPLVATAEKSWWSIRTGNPFDIIISNPVKVLLSISMLAIFVFIDIGFAIVFLNFLLFNEAFLCINYSIAGLSSGSRRNASLFGSLGIVYLVGFALNLLYAPYIFSFLLNLPQTLYVAGYILFSVILSYHLLRLFTQYSYKKKLWVGTAITLSFFVIAFLFFPKERILDKAAMTKYRIDVLTMPVDKAIETAYKEGKTYAPVIRAAQNQWFINTLIYEGNNPTVQSPGFNLLPHAPQNKGAKYNAQATDLVASRFFLAEHGKWSVLLYMLLLILPTIMLASFYKLYPDFTNRTNSGYPVITTGFSILNYLLIAGLLVILAATGRYIFFGQDMPFASILSKQSILFPAILIITTVLLFKNIPLEYYANRKKRIPAFVLFSLLGILLFAIKPSFNRSREFNVAGLAKEMDDFVQVRLQPLLDHFDTSRTTRRLPVASKDRLFADSLRKLVAQGVFENENTFFAKETEKYTQSDFFSHLDQGKMLYLDLYSGSPRLSVNDHYFRIEPPPHLQEAWRGNVYGDSSIYNISLLNCGDGSVTTARAHISGMAQKFELCDDLTVLAGAEYLSLVNKGSVVLNLKCHDEDRSLKQGDSIRILNPSSVLIRGEGSERLLVTEPDAFMKNYYVNGSRFYVYPLANRFIWARNFAESIASSDHTNEQKKDASVSLDFQLMDSLSASIERMMNSDTAYKDGAEYGICIADGSGRLVAMADHIKGLARPDPNDKAGFNKVVRGDNGFISQSLLRKQIGNINLLRLNPGPGSTLKPIIFSAIASQLNIDWDAFSSEGFVEQQEYFAGEKVAKYDFEKYNGRISKITDYLRHSDNYYHANVLLLGSYRKQDLNGLLSSSFSVERPGTGLHWPWFQYGDRYYWLDGFEHWPGYSQGSVDFGSDSSFTSIGLYSNYGIYTHTAEKNFDMFSSNYDSTLFPDPYKTSGFILPEYPLFDQQGSNVNKKNAYDVFASCYRGHVKGSSQVLIPPAKMVEAIGKMVSQDRNYSLTLDPYPQSKDRLPFAVDNAIGYNNYLSIMREGVFAGMREALYNGTAAGLGALLKKDQGYYYYAKTGTTGDNQSKTKSKLMVVVISEKDITDPNFNFRDNKFYTVYFTLQNGPAKQNEAFQYEIIKLIKSSASFAKYF